MVNVELVDDEPPPGPESDPTTEWLRRAVTAVAQRALRAWRRPALRWPAIGVVVALVATLVTVRVAGDARDRTRLAALAQVPGVLRPLRQDLRVLYSAAGGNPYASVIPNGFLVGDVVVGFIHPYTTDWTAVGLDAGTGTPRWSTTLGSQEQWNDSVPRCSPTGAVVTCVVTWAASGRGVGTATTVWVIDPADGRIVRTATYGDHVRVVATGGLVVVGRQVSGPDRAASTGPWTVTWLVTGQDPVSGGTRWSWTSPPLGVSAEDATSDRLRAPADYAYQLLPMSAAGAPPEDVALQVGDDTWLFGSAGAVRLHLARPGGWALEETRGGGIVRQPLASPPAISTPELLLDDGKWQALRGTLLPTTVDDGSAPDLVFLTDTSTLTALDRHTGARRWQVPIDRTVIGPLFSLSAMMLGGHLYTDTQDLRAYDASTGAILWRTPLAGGPLATDGTVAVVQSTDEEGFPVGVKAYRLADGRPVWSSDLSAVLGPEGVRLTAITFGMPLPHIVAVRSDGTVAVLG
jgi:outer membrane protein assembly factor BamB